MRDFDLKLSACSPMALVSAPSLMGLGSNAKFNVPSDFME